MREVTTQSAGGGIHTKFYSSSDSEPDELASSAVAVTHTESTSTITLPCPALQIVRDYTALPPDLRAKLFLF